VLEYFHRCGDFWDGNRGKLAEWTAQIFCWRRLFGISIVIAVL
jgi:hypothetical protein